MDSVWNLVGHLLLGKLLKTRNKIKVDSGMWVTELGMWVIGYEFPPRVGAH